MKYKSNNNIVYSCKYHVVFCPKYRRKVLNNGVDERLKELINNICQELHVDLIEMEVMPDHVHLLLEVDTLLMMIESKLDFKFSYGKTSFKDAALIRQAVFVEEQGFEKEFDKLDNTAYRLVIYKDEQPIAVGRMYFKDKTTMILGRIAAIKEYRGQKLGSKVVTALENKARELGCLETELSAQQQAQKFYEKLGYKPDGDMYYDEWCPHVTMKKIL